MKSSESEYWNHIYHTKKAPDLSWTQDLPEPSLSLITSLAVNKNSSIIDVGGGDSLLADYLLKDGYTDITVLDISQEAMQRSME